MAYIGNNLTVQQYAPTITYFSGNASTTAFTLPYAVVSAAQIIVTVENVIQNPSSAFTVSGTTLTFTSAPPTGTNNIWVEYTSLQTTANALPAYPSVTGDLVTSGGQYAKGAFSTAYTDGIVTDYTTGTGRITVGASDGIGFYNGGPSSRSWLFGSDSSGNVGIGTSSPAAKLDVSASSGTIFRALTNNVAQILIGNGGTSANYYDGDTQVFRSGNNTERMRITSGGNLLVGTTSSGSNTNNSVNIVPVDGRIWYSHLTGTPTGSSYCAFQYNGSIIGSIIQSGTNAVAYQTSSDYRLKENIAPMTGALDKVAQLKPVTYTWKTDGSDGQGFIAHELQEVVPDCVTGEKDAVDEEGKPVYQGIDTSFLVATLTAAIQEQQAIINELKSRIEVLETK